MKTTGLEMVAILDCGDSIIAAERFPTKSAPAWRQGGYRLRQETIDGFPSPSTSTAMTIPSGFVIFRAR